MQNRVLLAAAFFAAMGFPTSGKNYAETTESLTGRLQRVDWAINRQDADGAEKELTDAIRAAGQNPAHDAQAAFAEDAAIIRLLRGDPDGARKPDFGFRALNQKPIRRTLARSHCSCGSTTLNF